MLSCTFSLDTGTKPIDIETGKYIEGPKNIYLLVDYNQNWLLNNDFYRVMNYNSIRYGETLSEYFIITELSLLTKSNIKETFCLKNAAM